MTLLNRTWTIVGISGSIGRALARYIHDRLEPKEIRGISRSRQRQREMEAEYPYVRFFRGDIHSPLDPAPFDGADVVIHLAGLKRVDEGELYPGVYTQANVLGASGVLWATQEARVQSVLLISSNNACLPATAYGATKMLAERIFTAAGTQSKFASIATLRLGTMIGSQGGVLGIFRRQEAENKPFTITHPDMTRFWMTAPTVCEEIVKAVEQQGHGQIYVPNLLGFKVADLARAANPDRLQVTVGLRGTERIHEWIVSSEEARRTWRNQGAGLYVIEPEHPMNSFAKPPISENGVRSDIVPRLPVDWLRNILQII